jgi:hypothetical protein
LNRLKTVCTQQAEERARIDAVIADFLSSEEELIPTSGFLASVMERVEQEAVAPPPIPFPWKRGLPAIVLASGVFAWSAVEMPHSGLPAMTSMTQILSFSLQIPVGLVAPAEQVGWVALALGVSLASWLLSRRLVGGGGLL